MPKMTWIHNISSLASPFSHLVSFWQKRLNGKSSIPKFATLPCFHYCSMNWTAGVFASPFSSLFFAISLKIETANGQDFRNWTVSEYVLAPVFPICSPFQQLTKVFVRLSISSMVLFCRVLNPMQVWFGIYWIMYTQTISSNLRYIVLL